MKPREPKWASEADMMAVFITAAQAQGWRCYPETCGHDLVMVATAGINPDCNAEPGDVVAVEGKVALSMTVLRQALPPWRGDFAHGTEQRSADFYAVVVPYGHHHSDAKTVARALGIHVWEARPARLVFDRAFCAEVGRISVSNNYRCVGAPPLEVHGLDVDIRAGLPSPRAVTPWKLAAVRLCLLGRTRDLVVADFFTTVVKPRSFLERGWLRVREGRGKTAVFELLDATNRPDHVYPELVEALLAPSDDPSPAGVRP